MPGDSRGLLGATPPSHRRRQPTAKARPLGPRGARGPRAASLTLHAAAAGLQDPGVRVRPRLGRELVAHEVGVVRRGDEVVAQRPRHVLVYAAVLRVEDVARGAPSVVGEACWGSTVGARGSAPCASPAAGSSRGPPPPSRVDPSAPR